MDDNRHSGARKVTLKVADVKLPTGRYFWPKFFKCEKCIHILDLLAIQLALKVNN